MMVAKGPVLRSDAPALHRAVHGRQRREEHRRQVSDDPDFREGRVDGRRTKGMKIMMGSGADGSTYVHGTQALDFEMLVKRGGLTPVRALQAATIDQRRGAWAGRIRSDRSTRASTPISSPCPAIRLPTSPSCNASSS